MKKKLLIFSLAAIASAACAAGLSACFFGSSNGTDKNGLRYELSDDGTYYICHGVTTYEEMMTVTDVTIPSAFKNKPVKEISDGAFLNCTALTSVTIPESVTAIGSWAFGDCASLQTVELPSGLTEISSALFTRCYLLNNVTIPDGVTTIGLSAFENCTSLESIVIPDGVTYIGGSAFNSCTSLESFTVPDSVTELGENILYECTSLKSLTIGNGVTALNEISINCPALETVAVGDGVSVIDDSFRYSALKSITLGNGITTISANAFEGCSLLESITIPESVTSIGDSAFRGCSSLTEINFNAVNCKDFERQGVFEDAGKDGTGVTVNIGAKVTKLPANMLYSIYQYEFGNMNIVAVNFAEESVLESIGDYALTRCLITSIDLPDTLTYIGSFAFYGCNSLKEIVIPDSTVSIGESAFSQCSSLIKLTLGSRVSTIGNCAFLNCRKLVEVYNRSDISPTDDSTENGYAFAYALNIYTPDSGNSKITKQDGYIFIDTKSVDTNEPLYYLVAYEGTEVELTLPDYYDGKAYDINTNAFIYNYKIKSVVIPQTVKVIFDSAFTSCTALESVTIGENVTFIGEGAFGGCTALESVTFGENVTFIGRYAFSYCSALESVTIGENVTYIGEGAFSDCTALTSVYYNAVECEDINYGSIFYAAGTNDDGITLYIGAKVKSIPAYLTYCGEGYTSYITNVIFAEGSVCESIGDYALSGCLITSIELPDSLISIGSYAFYGCNSLKEIVIPDNATSVESGAFSNCTALESLVIPETIIKIEITAFSGCSKLGAVYYEGNSAQWDAIIRYKNYSVTTAYDIDLQNATLYFLVEDEADLPDDDGNYWHYVDGVPTAW